MELETTVRMPLALEAWHFTFGDLEARKYGIRGSTSSGGVSQMRTGGAQHTGDADEQMIVRDERTTHVALWASCAPRPQSG